MHSKRFIYLDYAATTPLDREVVLAMEPYWSDRFANPSSLHRAGQEAIKAVDDARAAIADFIGAARAREILFTGSATEANNLAIRGVLLKSGIPRPHIITTAIEHASVLEPIRALERTGAAEVTLLPVDAEGRVTSEAAAAAVKKITVLASIGFANNEIGTLQPIADIARAVKAKNPNVLVHTDAAQAAPWLDVNVKTLGADLTTLSAHKLYGPKGIGALYAKDGVKLEPIVYGGGQEYGLRSGTQNVPAIVGFATAAEIAGRWKNAPKNLRAMSELRDHAWREIQRVAPNAELNGPALESDRLPNNLNGFIPDVDPDVFLIGLSEDGVCISSGSACAARSQTTSHVIRAIGKASKKGCHLRITLGRKTTREDITALAEAIKKRLS